MNQEDMIRELRERYQQSAPSLNELQRRLWAASEAKKIGRGGITIVSKALRISPNTIRRGIQDIEAGQLAALTQANTRIRKPGGGRKSKRSVTPHHRGSATPDLRHDDRHEGPSAGSAPHSADTDSLPADPSHERR